MGKKEKLFYAVAKGYRIGIFSDWLDAGPSVQGFKGNLFRGYDSLDKAKEYMRNAGYDDPPLFIHGENINENTNPTISNSQVDNSSTETEVSAAGCDNSFDVENENEIIFNVDTLPFASTSLPDDLNQIVAVSISASCTQSDLQCDSNTNEFNDHIEQDDEMYGREDSIQNLPDVDDDQTYIKQYHIDSNTTHDNLVLTTVSSLGNLETSGNIDDFKEDTNVFQCTENNNANEKDEPITIDTVKSIIREQLIQMIDSDLELMKLQAKNEIKVSMNHKMQSVLDENEDLKNKIERLTFENQKLSSSLGDLKKYVNTLKCKYNDILDTNESLQKKLDTVMEQQKDIAVIGSSLCSVLCSYSSCSSKTHDEESSSSVPNKITQDKTSNLADGKIYDELREKPMIPLSCVKGSCDTSPSVSASANRASQKQIPSPVHPIKSAPIKPIDKENKCCQPMLDYVYSIKTSNHFDTLSSLREYEYDDNVIDDVNDNDNDIDCDDSEVVSTRVVNVDDNVINCIADNNIDNNYHDNEAACTRAINVDLNTEIDKQSDKVSKIQVHLSKPKSKPWQNKRSLHCIPRFQRQHKVNQNRNRKVLLKDRLDDDVEFHQLSNSCEKTEMSPYQNSYHENVHLYDENNCDINNNFSSDHADTNTMNSYNCYNNEFIHHNNFMTIQRINQQKYIQWINFHWYNYLRLFHNVGQNHGNPMFYQ